MELVVSSDCSCSCAPVFACDIKAQQSVGMDAIGRWEETSRAKWWPRWKKKTLVPPPGIDISDCPTKFRNITRPATSSSSHRCVVFSVCVYQWRSGGCYYYHSLYFLLSLSLSLSSSNVCVLFYFLFVAFSFWGLNNFSPVANEEISNIQIGGTNPSALRLERGDFSVNTFIYLLMLLRSGPQHYFVVNMSNGIGSLSLCECFSSSSSSSSSTARPIHLTDVFFSQMKNTKATPRPVPSAKRGNPGWFL